MFFSYFRSASELNDYYLTRSRWNVC